MQRAIFTWDGGATQTDPLYRTGAINQEVVQTIGSSIYFLSEGTDHLAVYQYSGGEPVDISSQIREFLKVSNLVSGAGVPAEFGSWKDEKNYYLSISDVIIDGQTLKNVVLCFNVISGSWTLLSVSKKTGTYNNFFKYSTTYCLDTVNSSVLFSDVTYPYTKHYTIIGGTGLGTTSTENVGISPVIWNYQSTNTDNIGDATTNPIDILIQTHELEFGSRSLLKTINKFNVFASGNYGFVTVNMRVNGGAWINLGKLTGKTTTFSPAKKGNYFEYQLIGSNTGEPFVFEGFDFFNVTIDNYPL